MNRINNWEGLLKISNEDLANYGYALKVYEPYEDGCYFLDILKDGKSIENYAGNYYEDELSDLVNDAWYYVKRELC